MNDDTKPCDACGDSTCAMATGADQGLPSRNMLPVLEASTGEILPALPETVYAEDAVPLPESSDRSDEPNPALADTVPASAVKMAEEACELDPILEHLATISEETGASLEDLAEAFVALRAESPSDEAALQVLVSLSCQARDPETSVTDLAVELVGAATDLAEERAKKVQAVRAPALVMADGKTPLTTPPQSGKVLAMRRRAKANGATIVVEGGAATPRIPDEDDAAVRGKPSAEMETKLKAGATAYHLDTLETLEAEAKAAETDLPLESTVTGDPPPAKASVFRSPPTLRSRSAGVVALMGMTAIVAGLQMGEPDPRPAPPPRPPVRGKGKPPVRRVSPVKLEAKAVPSRPGACSSAACRTLDTCLCDCRKCRAGCPRKRHLIEGAEA